MATESERIPPLPPKLKEMLVDYPEILQHLQESLIDAAQTKSSTPPFELALWRLEDGMSHFMIETGAERQAAEARGDPAEIGVAIAKHRLMSRARSMNVGLSDLSGLFDFFSNNGKRRP